MGPTQEEMAIVAAGLRNMQPRRVDSENPTSRHARWGIPPGKPTSFGQRVWDAGENGHNYGTEWLAGQLRQIGGAPGTPGGGAPAAVASGGAGGQVTTGPPAPAQGPPEPPPAPVAGSPSTLDQISPEMAQQLMSLGDKERQLALAEKMRDQEGGKGRTVSNGRIYVAGSPLDAGITAYQKFKGKRDADRIGEEQTAGRMSILDLLRKNQ